MLNEAALFQSQRKTHFTANSLQKRFLALYKKTEISRASPHPGRRTFITRLIESHSDRLKQITDRAAF